MSETCFFIIFFSDICILKLISGWIFRYNQTLFYDEKAVAQGESDW